MGEEFLNTFQVPLRVLKRRRHLKYDYSRFKYLGDFNDGSQALQYKTTFPEKANIFFPHFLEDVFWPCSPPSGGFKWMRDSLEGFESEFKILSQSTFLPSSRSFGLWKPVKSALDFDDAKPFGVVF